MGLLLHPLGYAVLMTACVGSWLSSFTGCPWRMKQDRLIFNFLSYLIFIINIRYRNGRLHAFGCYLSASRYDCLNAMGTQMEDVRSAARFFCR